MSLDLQGFQINLNRVGALAQRHESILRGFWSETRKTFGLESRTDKADHVTSSSTCVLSFSDYPGGKLPAFLIAHREEFVSWLLRAAWGSEDLGEHNVYTAPLALCAVKQMNPNQLENRKCVEAVEYLIKQCSCSSSGGVSFKVYPPSGFLTYWTVRAVWGAVNTYAEGIWSDQTERVKEAHTQIDRAVEWAEQEIHRQFSYGVIRDDRFDPLQMGYALSLVDLAREMRRKRPNRELIRKGLEILFEAQMPSGLWIKVAPIFHYGARGSVYPFAFETLTAVMRMCGRATDPVTGVSSLDLLEPHIPALMRTVAWAEATELSHEANGTQGWRSNHVLPGDAPQVWATAMVLSFVSGLYALLQRIIREEVLREFNARPPHLRRHENINNSNWTNLADSRTVLASTGKEVSLKGLIFKYLIQPHIRGAEPRLWSGIFFGPPGTAKTTLAHHIASALNWPLVTIETSDFLAQGADKLAHQARLIFRRLEHLSEAVILIDEVEEFVRDRKKSKERESRITTTAMLTLIQGLREKEKSILILATNHIDDFDRAIKRRGRFDLVLFVGPPSIDEKFRFLQEQLKMQGLGKTDALYSELRRSNDTVSRFTFADWTSFVNACCRDIKSQKRKKLDTKTFKRILDSQANSLTIDESEWKKWQKRESNVYD